MKNLIKQLMSFIVTQYNMIYVKLNEKWNI